MKKIYMLFLGVILVMASLFSQNEMVLQHKLKLNKQKTLELDRFYEIRTDSTIYHSSISFFSDTSLFIKSWVDTGRDSAYFYKYYAQIKDTFIIRSIHKLDTIEILFKDIIYLKTSWLKRNGFLEMAAWFSIGVIFAIPMLPIAAIDKGKEGVNEWLRFEAIMLSVAAPAIILGSINRSYNLIDDWVIISKKIP